MCLCSHLSRRFTFFSQSPSLLVPLCHHQPACSLLYLGSVPSSCTGLHQNQTTSYLFFKQKRIDVTFCVEPSPFCSSIMFILVYFLFSPLLRLDTLRTIDLALKPIVWALKLIFKMLLLLHARVPLLSARFQGRDYQGQLSSEQRPSPVKECPFVFILCINRQRAFK